MRTVLNWNTERAEETRKQSFKRLSFKVRTLSISPHQQKKNLLPVVGEYCLGGRLVVESVYCPVGNLSTKKNPFQLSSSIQLDRSLVDCRSNNKNGGLPRGRGGPPQLRRGAQVQRPGGPPRAAAARRRTGGTHSPGAGKALRGVRLPGPPSSPAELPPDELRGKEKTCCRSLCVLRGSNEQKLIGFSYHVGFFLFQWHLYFPFLHLFLFLSLHCHAPIQPTSIIYFCAICNIDTSSSASGSLQSAFRWDLLGCRHAWPCVRGAEASPVDRLCQPAVPGLRDQAQEGRNYCYGNLGWFSWSNFW